MSTYLGIRKSEKTVTLEDLSHYFDSFGKPEEKHGLGIEWELFGVRPATGQALPYSGSSGIEEVLRRLSARFGYSSIVENSHIIALYRGENYVALEPGAQLELSAPPVATVQEIERQLNEFRAEILAVSEGLDAAWLTCGFHPFSKLDEIEWVPKKRYQIMREVLARQGAKAHDMMKRTAANQVNIDFSGEEDAMEKMRIIFAATSIVSALFAHSPLEEGRVSGYLTRRMASWLETDPKRTGLIESLLGEASTFQDYLNYVLDAPMMFIIRKEAWVSITGMTFRDYLVRGFEGHKATLEDFELHLSTLFPEARIKNCIEIRGADGQRFEMIPAVPALWKGLLYDKEARVQAWKLLKSFSWAQRLEFQSTMIREGLSAHIGGVSGWEVAANLVEIARAGLSRWKTRLQASADEMKYLDRLKEQISSRKKTPAESLLDFRGTGRDPAAIVQYLKL